MPQTTTQELIDWLELMRDSGVWEHLRYDTYFDECADRLRTFQKERTGVLDAVWPALRALLREDPTLYAKKLGFVERGVLHGSRERGYAPCFRQQPCSLHDETPTVPLFSLEIADGA